MWILGYDRGGKRLVNGRRKQRRQTRLTSSKHPANVRLKLLNFNPGQNSQEFAYVSISRGDNCQFGLEIQNFCIACFRLYMFF